MQPNMCMNCGGDYEYRHGRWVCRACGSYKPEELSNEEVTLIYTASQKLRLADFDEAEQEFDDIVRKYPQSPNGYWGRLMSRYGIKYEEDFDGRRIPTCYATSIESVISDPDYKKALQYADEETKAFYTEQAGYIDRVRKEWVEKARKEKPYDIFICYKDSDLANGIERTEDSIAAQDLYIHLTNKGYRVFYSHESLRDKVGEKYEPYIFNALSTAKVMLVYGSKPEYITSTWLKNEWTRYEKRIKAGDKLPNSLLVACDGFSPNALPKMLSSKQCFNAKERSFYGDLDDVLERIMQEAKEKGKTRVEEKPVKKKRKSPVIAALLAVMLLALGGAFAMNLLKGGGGGGGTANTVTNAQFNATVVAHDYTFPEGTSFSVDEIPSDQLESEVWDTVHTLPVRTDNCHVYDMNLMLNGNTMAVDGNITVTLALPSDIDASRAVVYYLNGSTAQKISSEAFNGKITFVTSHFSYYMIAESEDSAVTGPVYIPGGNWGDINLGTNPGDENCDHVEETLYGFEPTCTEAGLTDGSACSLCGMIFVPQTEIEPLGHSPKLEAPTCTEAQQCAVCGEIMNSATGHIPDRESPTCTESQHCVVCGVLLAEAMGHAPGYAATCTTPQTCYQCGEVMVKATGHKAGEAPTCTTPQDCMICGEILKEAIGHTPGAAPTCTLSQVCSVCHEELMPPLGHTEIIEPAVGPTCTTSGLTEGSYCSVCHTRFRTQQVLEATGHFEIVNGAVEPTCYSTGLTQGLSCANCNEILIPQETIPMTEHKEIILSAYAPTCTDPGRTEGSACADCGVILMTQEEIPATGHTYEFVLTPPTATDDGMTHYECSVCGDAYDETIIPTDVSVSSEKRTQIGFTGAANEELIIPSVYSYDGSWYRVTSIADGAFANCTELLSVTIPTGVTTIGVSAFSGCTKLHTVSIPQGVEVIGDSAFADCTWLTTLTLPDSVYSIGAGAFENCAALPSVALPAAVTVIGDATFAGCTSLGSVMLRESVTTVGASAFGNCPVLADVFYTGTEAAWAEMTVNEGNEALTSATVHYEFDPNHVHVPGDPATCTTAQICTECGVVLASANGHIRVTDAAVAPTCTEMGLTEGAHCASCGEIFTEQKIIPANGHVEYTVSAVDPTCTEPGLTQGTLCKVCDAVIVEQVEIPANGHSYVTESTPPTETEDGKATHTCSVCGDTYDEVLTLGEFTVTAENRDQIGFTGAADEKLVIPAVFVYEGVWYRVTAIGDDAFTACTSLISVSIPDSVTSIGANAFAGCSSLATVVFSDQLTVIGSSAFAKCSGLTAITIPETVTHIESGAFTACTGLNNVEFSENGALIEIDSYAFSDCTALTEITVPETVTFIYQSVFKGCTGLERITLPFVGYTLNATRNMHFSYIFGAATADTSAKFVPESLKYVRITGGEILGLYAFRNCAGLTEIVLPETLTTIDKSAFSGCTGLTSLTMPDTVTKIGDFAFNGCTSLTTILVPAGVESIGIYTFLGCSALETVYLPETLTSIGDSAFKNCTALTEVHYAGTADGWTAIHISTGNGPLTSATIIYA